MTVWYNSLKVRGGFFMKTWHPNKRRIIFHIDMNCFYASVEMAHDTSLKGKPIAIAGNPEKRKGIIVTSSYEARAKGVKTTMPLWEAKKLCPELIVRPPRFERYRAASKKMFTILSEITPFVEPISIDEGYMDVTDINFTTHPVETAKQLQKRLLDELDLPCSIGIGPNKFLAKTASDMKKPLGITILRKRELHKTLWPLPVDQMYGIGEKTAEKLRKIQVNTIGELAERNVYDLTQLLGVNGERLKNRANGVDVSPVDPDSVNEFKSIGSSQTLPADTTSEADINQLFVALCERVEQRMKRRQVVGLSVQIMIRYHDRHTVTRSQKLVSYIEDQADILTVALELFQKHWNEEPVRLLGVTVQHIEEKSRTAKQMDLFTYEKDIKKEQLKNTIDHLSKKYGKQTFTSLKAKDNHDAQFTTSFQKDFLDDFQE